MVARRVAGNEDGVAAPHEAFHMPDEHLRGQAALVHGEPVASSAMALSVGSLTTTVRPMDSKNVVHSTPKR